jgi:hypothetical protein
MRMSRPVSLFLVLSTIGCSNLETSQQAPLLTLQALQQAERIIPTPAGYLLVEWIVAPRNEESGRQLLLYDAQGNFEEAIRLFGTVQEANRTSLVINHPLDHADYAAPTNIGFLTITYRDLTRLSKGGGRSGSFLVDSMQYNAQTKRVLVYAKAPRQQLVLEPRNVRFEQGTFMHPVHVDLPLHTLDFHTDYFGRDSVAYFQVTSWKANQTNSTVDYYVTDKQVITDLLQQVVGAHLTLPQH